MDALRQYILSVTAAALICGILSGLVQNGAAKEILRLLCGLFLTIVVIRPLIGLDLEKLTDWSLDRVPEGESMAALGENMARQAAAEIIKSETEAYILDKAAALNASLTVEVTVSGDDTPLPVAVTLRGEIAPNARQQLEHILQTELGIAKEDQQWNG